MDNNKILYIENLIERREKIFLGGQYNFLIHSILNSIDLNELIDYYLLLRADSEIRRSIESNIYKRVIYENHEDLFDRLLQCLDDATYFQRQRIRKILLLILPYLNISCRHLFFDLFYNSKYSYDVRSALSICKELWDNSFNEMILSDYLKVGDEAYLKTFLEFGDAAYSLPYLEHIWSFDPSNYLKMNLIKKLSREHLEKFYFLRQLEPEKYLLGMSYSNKSFDEKTIIDCFNDIDEEAKPYGLMSLGRIINWDSLEKVIKKYVS